MFFLDVSSLVTWYSLESRCHTTLPRSVCEGGRHASAREAFEFTIVQTNPWLRELQGVEMFIAL